MDTKRPTNAAAEDILGGYFPVLDHGFVALVDYMGSDEDVERAARVSYGYGTRKTSQTRGLVRYLRRHRHTTPSEMVELKFHCAMPMFVARQWIRHRTACLAEGTEVHFDLPGGVRRRGSRLNKLTIDEIWDRFQPSRNRTRPDKQRDPFFERERVRGMLLRQVNEDTGRIQHTRVVDVFRNGAKPCFRMVLADGKTIAATADHRFLFADGWSTLAAKTGLREVGGRAVWEQGEHYLHVNGMVCAAAAEPATGNDPIERSKLVRIERFEYVGVKETYDLEVEGPYHNFVANGIVTHNSVNEYSGRYSLMPLLFYTPERDNFALQSQSNRQGRDDSAGEDVYREAVRRWEEIRAAAAGGYSWMIQEDVARELARIDLPLSTYTQWYWKIDLHNLLHFLSLRVDPHAQWEIQAYARVMAGMVKRVAPLSYEAWVDYDLEGRPFSRGERGALSRLLRAEADGSVGAREGGRLTPDDLKDLGLSGREVAELAEKLEAPGQPDFELDLSLMRSGEEVGEEMERAVPSSFE